MKKELKLLSAAGLVALTAGCGGGGDEAAPAPPPPGFTSYAQISAAADAMRDDPAIQFDEANAANQPFAILAENAAGLGAVGGQATYEGFVRGDVNGSELVGELAVNVDFDQADVTASADNFYHETDGAYTGPLASSQPGDIIDVAGGDTLSTDLVGTLSNGGVDYDTNIALDGYFKDAGGGVPGAIGGTAVGTMTNGGVSVFDGTFVGESQ